MIDASFLRDRIKSLRVRLDYAGGVMTQEELPFVENVKFEFINASIVYGYKVYDGNEIIWEEKFPNGPFNIPAWGGTIEINPYNLNLDGVPIYDIMNGQMPATLKPSPYRSIMEPWQASW